MSAQLLSAKAYLKRKFFSEGLLFDILAAFRRVEYKVQCRLRESAISRLSTDELNLPVSAGTSQLKNMQVLWIGADDNQDSLGFLDELGSVAKISVFTNQKGAPKLFYDYSCWDISLRNAIQLLETLNRKRYDIVVGQFWPELIDLSYPPLRKHIVESKIKVVCVAMDDFMPGRWLPDAKHPMAGPAGFGRLVDLYATSDVCSVQRYHSLGLKAVYMPFGCSKSIRQINCERDLDVVFVGSNYGARRSLISRLIADGINVKAYGPGFANGYVSANKIMELYSRAKVVLGICNVAYQIKERNLKTRDFDAISAGALYVANACTEFNQFFAPGIHYVHYAGYKDLLPKLRYCLGNPTVSREIAERAYALGTKKYLWRDILASVLAVV